MSVLYIRDKNGNLVPVPALIGTSPVKGVDYWTEADKNEMISEVIAALQGSGTNDTIIVPDYWQSYLSGKTVEIDSAINAAEGNRSAFLWYTDAHWANNYKMSPVLLKYLSKNTGMEKTFFGGDITVATSGEIDSLRAWQGLVKDIPNHHSVIGNHDNQVSELPTAVERGNFFLMPERTGDVVFGTDATNGNNYYYIDNHIEKTRYICLSTGRMWTYKDEVEWCVNVLNETPKNWHIVIISHLWLNNDYDNGGIITTPESYVQLYLDLFDDYNHRKSGITNPNSVSYDFTSASAKIEFIMGGHVHKDYDFTTTEGIPVILTECDAWEERDDASTATQGTTTESCVYAIVADYGAKIVKVINVGRGDSRDIAIPDVATYTNVLATAGYKTDTRISVSSGNFEEKTESGWCATGLIPVKTGDVVRLYNCVCTVSTTASTHRGGIFGADADGNYNNSQAYVKSLSADWNAVFADDGDNLIQFTVPSWMGATYIRIVAQVFTGDSVITVNEEIV